MFPSPNRISFLVTVFCGIAACAFNNAWSHCDTYSGPVISEARKALESGDVTPLFKWVPKSDEVEIKAAFAKVRAVRTKSPEIKEIADQYFLETLVRIHRMSEGAPFTGLKNVPPEPIEVLADKALETGDADSLVVKMSGHLAHEVKAKFQKVLEAGKHQNESVEAGRKFVDAYVTYLHYIIGIHDAVAAKSGHGEACPTKGKMPKRRIVARRNGEKRRISSRESAATSIFIRRTA